MTSLRRGRVRRPTVVLVCFECVPGAGSEAGAGWAWAKAAAEEADVIILTDRSCVGRAWAGARATSPNISIVGVGPSERVRRLFPAKAIFGYYVLWQAMAAQALRRCEREAHIDAVHHVTWASDSLPSALLASHAPVRIWGPVGGTTGTAPGLYRYLTPRGRLDQRVRGIVNGTLRGAFGRLDAKHATLVVALNDDVADHFRPIARTVIVEPNLALEPEDLFGEPDASTPVAVGRPGMRTAVFVGRLIPWKGLLLAIRAVAHAPGWRLVVMGTGPDRIRGEQLASELGIADRVEFVGQVPRDAVLGEFARADALLLPSFHDSAPWAAGEAAAMGCPVVCLDAGGTALLAGANGHPVAIGDGARLPERIAVVLEQLGRRPAPDHRWDADRIPGLLHDWYGSADDQSAHRPTPLLGGGPMIDLGKRSVLGVHVDAVDLEAAVERITFHADHHKPYLVTALAAHGVIEAARHNDLRASLNDFDAVLPDGQAVCWALNALYPVELAAKVPGPAVLDELLDRAAAQGESVYFYGSTPNTLRLIREELDRRYDGKLAVHTRPSLFGSADASVIAEIADDINRSGAWLCFVGLGCPRQERFVAAVGPLLDMPSLAVGAGFDYLAGSIRRAPALVQRTGMEWAYRLGQEPRRLAGRYVSTNTQFMAGVSRQLVGAKVLGQDHDPLDRATTVPDWERVDA